MFSSSNKRTLSNNLILIWIRLHDRWVTHQRLVHLFGVPHLFLVMFDLALDQTEQDLDDVILLQAIINHNYHSKDPRNQSSDADMCTQLKSTKYAICGKTLFRGGKESKLQ